MILEFPFKNFHLWWSKISDLSKVFLGWNFCPYLSEFLTLENVILKMCQNISNLV